MSELLGSFGDNELSPECLDGAQRFLKGNKSALFSLVNSAQQQWSFAENPAQGAWIGSQTVLLARPTLRL